jgi:hypothetical protein
MDDFAQWRSGYDDTGNYRVPTSASPVRPPVSQAGNAPDTGNDQCSVPLAGGGEALVDLVDREQHHTPASGFCPECRAAPGQYHNSECSIGIAQAIDDNRHHSAIGEDNPFPDTEAAEALDADVSGLDKTAAAVAEFSERLGRTFPTGAYRDSDDDKPDYAGYLSPLVIQAYGQYMLKHQVQSNGELRASDNWQAGIPRGEYLKSMWRHLLDLWLEHDGYQSRDGIDEALGGLVFNVCGFWLETLKERRQ